MPEMAFRIATIALTLATCCHASDVISRNESSAVSGRYVKFPVIHSTNTDVFSEVWAKRELWSKRGIQTLPLANRSDVAYYAKCMSGICSYDACLLIHRSEYRQSSTAKLCSVRYRFFRALGQSGLHKSGFDIRPALLSSSGII